MAFLRIHLRQASIFVGFIDDNSVTSWIDDNSVTSWTDDNGVTG